MKDHIPDHDTPAPVETRAPFWSPRKRRPFFLLLLVIGLALLFVWMPDQVRASLWARLRAERVLVGLLFLFALLTVSLIWSAGERLDSRVFLILNLGKYPKWMDRVMWLVTQLGNVVTALLLALLFYLQGNHGLTFGIIIGTITLWLQVETIKALSDRDRPFLALENARLVGWRERGHSFPSGHSAQTFFLVTLLILQLQLHLVAAVVLYLVAALVGFTRIYVGAHYPRDVFGGAVLGSIWGILTALVDPSRLGWPF
jgi:membrane-associated phospholipid phosphatase